MDEATYQAFKARVQALKPESYRSSQAVVGLNLTLLAVSAFLFLSANPFFYALGAAAWALQMLHAYLIVHECAHGSFFKTGRANAWCGNFFAIMAFVPFYSRRYEHAMHHRVAGSFEEPSTQRALTRFNLIDRRKALLFTICWKLWVPILSLNEHLMLWCLPFEKGAQGRLRGSAIAMLGLYAALFLTALFAVPNGFVWLARFLPVFYLYMVLVEYFNLPHHLSAPIEDLHGPVPLYRQAHYTRSCKPFPWPLGKWLLLNFNYHVAHHLHPGVHWSKLGEAHEIMRELDPSIAGMHGEWEVNVGLRRQSLRNAFSKYLDYQLGNQ